MKRGGGFDDDDDDDDDGVQGRGGRDERGRKKPDTKFEKKPLEVVVATAAVAESESETSSRCTDTADVISHNAARENVRSMSTLASINHAFILFGFGTDLFNN